ncbi:aldo/keto reductase [Levilactobacillus bambusae]|uniref:2,5-diketo-D-gluconic acid reductase n=1 Tax=Levilactobacillus bambusae TaxID=2024736 RepID=A0A2V1MZ50_9LACO|nr:aldo/keto reductase [Levilactobacillus bambusae]PWG00249.1 2,5-diketo-D-gluconic acid reductase [Levilactobacillus bambusae]
MTVLDSETYKLSNGTVIPKLGFGTWQIPNGDVAYNAVKDALKVGYRHIDTARAYENEASVGKAIKDSGIFRDEIFVTTKLPAEIKTYEGAMASFEESLKQLDMDYVDLYIIHAPWPWNNIGKDEDAGNKEAWRALEDIYKSGRAKAIGVSNFAVHDLQNIMGGAEIKPMINQIQYYIGYTEPEITQFSQKNDIVVEAYSPLATGDMLKNAEIKQLADKYNVTPAQLALKFVLENGLVALPKATSLGHIENNADLGFSINDTDMKTLNAMKDPAPEHFHPESEK